MVILSTMYMRDGVEWSSKDLLDMSPSLLDALNDPVPSLLPIISYPLFIGGPLCDHADCQRGNPCVKALCFSYKGFRANYFFQVCFYTIPCAILLICDFSHIKNLVPIPSESEGIPDSVCDVPLCDNPAPFEAFKDHSKIVVDSNDDSSSSDDDSFSSKDIDYIDASPPDVEIVSLEVVKIVIPEVGGSDDDILLTIKDDILQNSSGSSTTSLSDYSLLDYEAFYLDDDHIEEKSSGSTTTHADFSQYDSFIFDLSIDLFPPTDRSVFYHEEFADELPQFISPPEYDCFYFKSEPDPGELTSIVDSEIRENVLPTTNVNLPFEDDQSPLLAYVVWIFLPFLTYPVTPPYLLSCGNEDTIFDPGISVYHSFMPSVSHRSGTFMKFNVYPNHLNESPMEILSSTCSPMDQ
ncbi:hypothetical protein Tco_0045360 [Tanacetum coccineum]